MQKEKKKNTEWTIDLIGNCNIKHIKEDILSFSEEWLLDTSRQETYKTHKDTKMYQIRYMDYDWTEEMPIEIKEINSLNREESNLELDSIFKQLELFYNGKVVRAEFINMEPNSSVRPHVDGGSMLYVSRRCHIPIVTNDDVYFTVLNNTVNMKEGNIYEINNGMPHSVENKSNRNRVHLIIDILPNRYFI